MISYIVISKLVENCSMIKRLYHKYVLLTFFLTTLFFISAASQGQGSAEKEKEKSELKNSRDRQIWIQIFGSGILFFLILVVLLQKRNELQKQKIQSLHQQKEIERLEGMINGQERERQRIAKDLHDGAGALLSTAILRLRHLNKKPHVDAVELHHIEEMLLSTADDIKRTSNNLMPDILLEQGLGEALEEYCSGIQKATTVTIELSIYGEIDILSYEFQLTIFRMVQELLANSIKHANAKTVLVQIILDGGRLSLTVEDDGAGLNPEKVVKGHGLRNIEERVKALGGNFILESAIGTGTSISAEFVQPNFYHVSGNQSSYS